MSDPAVILVAPGQTISTSSDVDLRKVVFKVCEACLALPSQRCEAHKDVPW